MSNPRARHQKIHKKNRVLIERFISTCRVNVIKILLVELPSPHSWNNAGHNAVMALAESYGLVFIDLNARASNYEIDFDMDFRDDGNHMKHYGTIIHREIYQGEVR